MKGPQQKLADYNKEVAERDEKIGRLKLKVCLLADACKRVSEFQAQLTTKSV